MSKDFEQTNESDDLIAELARLMAEDARDGSNQSQEFPMPAANDEVLVNESESAPDVEQTPIPQIDKSLDNVLSASERLSVTRSAKEIVTNEIGVDEQSLTVDAFEEETVAQTAEVANEPEFLSPLEGTKESADPIADLIFAQLGVQGAGVQEAGAQEIGAQEATDSFTDSLEEKHNSFNAQDEIEQPQPDLESTADNFANDPVIDPVISLGEENAGKTSAEQIVQVEQPAPLFAPQANKDVRPIAQQQEIDPLTEIENLIGEAVRDNAKPQEIPEPIISDVNFENPSNSIDEASFAAESAILATATDSQNPESSLQSAQNVDEHQATNQPQKSSFLRSILGPSVAGAILLVGGFGVYYYLNQGDNNGTIPVLSADGTPEKIIPQTTATDNTSQSVVMDKLSGEGNSTESEQLVSRDESLNNDPIARVIATNETTPSGIANRKVRTVTVRPDGTIISGDSARAGSEALPVDRPNVPVLPANPTNPAALQVGQPVASEQSPQIAITTTAPASTVVAVAPNPASRPATPVATPAITGAPPANSGAVNLLANSASQSVATTPVTQIITTGLASGTGSVSGTSAAAYVQVSSQRSEEVARRSLSEIQTRFSSVIGGSPLEVQRADLGDRGIYYRVRIPADSVTSANQLCNNLKQAGGDCFVRTD
ncbi:MAG: SPOR domain-containing protein [Devosiaceae bacterium]|nr:SPOR domain-containing protein [Devosiaceae bacterium]